MHRETSAIEQGQILEHPEIQRFITGRGIRSEDFPLIVKLAAFPKSLITTLLHNHFSMLHERSGPELDIMIRNASNQESEEVLKLFKEINDKYGWAVSWNLVTVLERI